MILRYRTLRASYRTLGLLNKIHRTHFHHPQLAVFTRYYASNERSKVEETLKMLKDDLQRQQEEDAKQKKVVPAGPKLPIMTRILNELKHYYHGFRLLALETRLSAKYLYRMAKGHSLTRRERQQLIRTVSDLFRLVPFSIFIIVPFMELALPIFIKLFPNMLPSTFQEASKEKEKIRRQVKVKVEMAKFLQDTLEEIALERKNKASSDTESKAYEFAQFLRQVRSEGSYVTNADLFKYMKLFEDELTLDNLSMSQLRALCRMLGVQPLGTPEILRFQLKLKLRDLKADDRLIAAEGGVDALSAADLQTSCRARGMRALGVSEERLRTQLKQWLELSLNDKVPPSLLLLSRALYLPEELTFSERLKTILSSLPEELGEQTRQKLTELEGGTVDPKARLELIKSIELHLKQEREVAKQAEKSKEAEKLKAKEKEMAQAEEQRTMDQVIDHATKHVEALHDVVADLAKEPVLAEGATKEEKLKTKEKVDKNVLESLEDILHGSPIAEAKHDIEELKEKVIEHTEDLIEVGSLADDYAETKVAKRLRARVNSMISGVDTLVARLEVERRNIKEEISDPALPESAEKKEQRLVRIKDLLMSLSKLKDVADDVKSKRIEEVLHAMDVDTDGKVDVNLALEVLELIGMHKDVEIDAKQMASIVEMLKKEDAIEAIDRANESHADIVDKEILPKLPADEQFPVRSKATAGTGVTLDEALHKEVEGGDELGSLPPPPPDSLPGTKPTAPPPRPGS